jgi:hypothetical protein
VPALGTLLALKELFKARRVVTGAGPHQLTPADIGFTIMVDTADATVRLPRIPGDTPSGTSALGEGAAICVLSTNAEVTIESPAPVNDTFNVGQAFPITLVDNGDWCIFASDGGPTRPADWLALCVPGTPE